MEKLYKTTQAQEFCSLLQALENNGYNASSVADILKKTPGYISQVKSGKTNPSEATLDLLREKSRKILKPETKQVFTEKEIHDRLDDLLKSDPDGYAAAAITIDALHRRINSSPASSPRNDTTPDSRDHPMAHGVFPKKSTPSAPEPHAR